MASYSISVTRNDGSSAVFELHPGKTTIGQQRGEIATLDPSVADPHGELHFDGTTLTYVDSGSPAGSFLPTGQRLSAPVTLQAGGIVCFGTCRLTVQAVRPTLATPPASASATGPYGASAAAPQIPHGAPPAQSVAQAPYNAPQVPHPAAAPPAPAYGLPNAPAAPSAALASDDPPPGAGVIDQLKHHLRVGIARYKQHYLNGVLTIGLIVIPAALINALLGWIPVVGFLVALAVGLVELILIPLSAGAMGRWALSTAAGKDLHWKKAWKNAFKDPVQEWLNVFVAQLITILGFILLVVPGLIVGMFALPAYLLEGKKFHTINGRSAELVMKDAGGILGLGLLTLLSFVPMAFLVATLSFGLGFIPFVGEPLASFLSVTLNILVAPFLYLLWAQVYYSTVRRLEGTNPVATHSATIEGWSSVE